MSNKLHVEEQLNQCLDHFSLHMQSFNSKSGFSSEVEQMSDEICKQVFYVLSEFKDAIVKNID